MHHVPAELWVLLVSATEDGLFIHCLPNRDGRVPDGMETLRWSVETANGGAQLRVLKTERFSGDLTVGLTCVGRRARDRALLTATRRFAEGVPFAIDAVRIEIDEHALRFAATPGWTRAGSRRYEKADAGERAA